MVCLVNFSQEIFFKKAILGYCLRCFADISLREATRCEQRKGFRSCYIKYDEGCRFRKCHRNELFFIIDMAVSGRGCSTKHQMFSTSCENHVMGGSGEEM